ncbi:hypothetical protein [Pseudomonas pergaminensis]
MDIVEFFQKYNGTLAVLISIVVALIAFYNYIVVRRSEERGRQYDRYHRLLEDLNIRNQGDAPFIDRQIAVVYELRNFPEYYPVTLRILKRSLAHWRYLEQTSKILNNRVNTLFSEAELTIGFIKEYYEVRSYLCLDNGEE